MVAKLLNFIIYRIYLSSREYLLSHNNLVKKDDFDYVFWGNGL